MEAVRRKGFLDLEFDARVILVGQIFITTGTAFLSLGQIFKLLKVNELPTSPVNLPTTQQFKTEQKQSYTKRHNYFES